jgi:hypothetical protein
MEISQTNHLSVALHSLREEEEKVASEIKQLQAKLDDLRAAIISVNKILRPSQASLPILEPTAIPIESVKSPYAGLTIREGIIRYLKRYPEPSSTASLTKGMLNDGFPNEGASFEKIVYTTMRRLQGEGRDFYRDPITKKWSLKEDA